MKLYNIYLRQLEYGIEIKVGDTARGSLANGDRHQAGRDNLIGYYSGRNRKGVANEISKCIGLALANNGRLVKNGRKEDNHE